METNQWVVKNMKMGMFENKCIGTTVRLFVRHVAFEDYLKNQFPWPKMAFEATRPMFDFKSSNRRNFRPFIPAQTPIRSVLIF